MASQETPNYRLSRWAGTDRILVEEFNDNWDKIDTALKGNADAVAAETAAREAAEASFLIAKLLEMTTTETLSEVTLDLSGIDLTRYHKLDIWVMPVLEGNSARNVKLYANGETQLGSASGGTDSTSLGVLCFHVYLGHNISSSVTCCYITSNAVNGAAEKNFMAVHLTPDQLKTFRLAITHSSVPATLASMEAGSTFHIYGLKK